VSGDDGERAGDITVRDRNARVGRGGDGARYARHDFKRDSGAVAVERLFAAAPEHKRIATLQPHNQFARLRLFDQQRVDLWLWDAVIVLCLARVDHFGVGAHLAQQFMGNQAVMDDDIGAPQQRQALDGDQARIAGTRPHEINRTYAHVFASNAALNQ